MMWDYRRLQTLHLPTNIDSLQALNAAWDTAVSRGTCRYSHIRVGNSCAALAYRLSRSIILERSLTHAIGDVYIHAAMRDTPK